MPPTEFFLEGKRAMVIAGSRGIGKGVALAFADAGADVAVSGLTTTNAEKVAQEIKAMGRQSVAYGADATKGDAMEKLAEQSIREFGPFDVVVNCLGDHITAVVAKRPGREEKVADEELWHTIMDINLTEAFLGCHFFGPQLLERKKGTVINIGAFHSDRTRPGFIPYASSKKALSLFTTGVALEWAPYGVTCNCIGPGIFPDREYTEAPALQNLNSMLNKRVPLSRPGTMREVGLLAVYLASDAASYITGQTIIMDGGLSIAPQEPDV